MENVELMTDVVFQQLRVKTEIKNSKRQQEVKKEEGI